MLFAQHGGFDEAGRMAAGVHQAVNERVRDSRVARPFLASATTAEGLNEALQALVVENLGLDGEGGVVQPGDEIAAYHEEGMGFGVLAKLYAMAAELQEACAAVESDEVCGATAAELVDTSLSASPRENRRSTTMPRSRASMAIASK